VAARNARRTAQGLQQLCPHCCCCMTDGCCADTCPLLDLDKLARKVEGMRKASIEALTTLSSPIARFRRKTNRVGWLHPGLCLAGSDSVELVGSGSENHNWLVSHCAPLGFTPTTV